MLTLKELSPLVNKQRFEARLCFKSNLIEPGQLPDRFGNYRVADWNENLEGFEGTTVVVEVEKFKVGVKSNMYYIVENDVPTYYVRREWLSKMKLLPRKLKRVSNLE